MGKKKEEEAVDKWVNLKRSQRSETRKSLCDNPKQPLSVTEFSYIYQSGAKMDMKKASYND